MNALAWVLAIATSAAEPQRFEFEEPHMGTRFRLVCYAPDAATAQRAAKEAFARVAFLDATMSDYNPASELMRLCAKSAETAGEAVKVSPELFAVLMKANQISELSGGAFDVTIGPVVQLWRHARKTQRLPNTSELALARKRVGYKNVQLDAKARTVTLLVPGMRLDLGGIAKGYAADAMLEVCAKHGITSALAAAGGDVAVADAPPGRDAWSIDIEPLPGTKATRTLKLKNMAVSTSGDTQQFVVIDGVRYSHVVDPRTGVGLTGSRLVTVVAKRGTESDPLTKLAAVLPPGEAMPLLAKIDGVAACLVWKGDKGEVVKMSAGFEALLVK